MARIRGGRRRDAIWRLRIRFFESHHHLFSGKFSSSKEAAAGADVVSVRPFPKTHRTAAVIVLTSHIMELSGLTHYWSKTATSTPHISCHSILQGRMQ